MKNTIKIVIAIAVIATLSGCGSLFGVREFEAWNGGPRWEFMEGQDFHVGFNGIDNVEAKRGVTRGRQQGQAHGATKAKY